MKQDQLKGGKADNMSIDDIARKHGVSPNAIKKEIEIGMEIEKEHTSSKKEQKEIAKDHVVEDEKYYTDPETGLIAKEKESKRKNMNEETKKMMALAGIKESDKKFLTNEAFSEEDQKQKSEKPSDNEFITMEFEQTDVESGQDDDKLYKLG